MSDIAMASGFQQPKNVKAKELHLGGGIRGLLRLVSTRPWLLGGACVAGALGAAFGLVPYVAVFGIAKESLSRTPDVSLVWWYALMGVLFTFLKFLGLIVSHCLAHAGAFSILYDLRVQLAHKLGSVPLGFFHKKQAGSVQKAMVDDVNGLESFLAHMLPDAASAFTVPLFAFAVMLWVDWRMALASLIALPFALLTQVVMLSKEGKESYERFHHATEATKRAVLEYLRGIHVVKTFGLGARNFGELRKAVDEMNDYVEEFAKKAAPPYVIGMKLISGGSSALFIVPIGIWLLRSGRLDMPTFLFFLLVGTQILSPFLRISNVLGNLQLLMKGAENIQTILAYPSLPECDSVPPNGHDVSFQNVTFAYGEDAVLKDLQFHAKAGEVTALVGPSGAGKSTVLRLISRFWDCQQGDVQIGGSDVRHVNLDAHLARLSLVFQEVFLFRGSIRENLLIAKSDASEEELRRACQIAQIHDTIVALPKGYDTVLGERGARLSGGEKQRLSIARAVLKDAPILLLDEATAFADPANEVAMQQALSEASQGKTMIVVAHRLSTIRHADRIVVLEKGSVVDQGTHQQLIERCALYQRLWQNYEQAAEWSFTMHTPQGEER